MFSEFLRSVLPYLGVICSAAAVFVVVCSFGSDMRRYAVRFRLGAVALVLVAGLSMMVNHNLDQPLQPKVALAQNAYLDAQLAAQGVALRDTITSVECWPDVISAKKVSAMTGVATDNDNQGFACRVLVKGQAKPVDWRTYDTHGDDNFPITIASIAELNFSATSDSNGSLKLLSHARKNLISTQQAATAIKSLLDRIGQAPAANTEAALKAVQVSAQESKWASESRSNEASWSK